jgi:hypothetical protein
MKKHNFSDEKQEENINNLLFAKEFFSIMDTSHGNGLSLEEIAVPHITLGLSSDSNFIKKVLRNINPVKFATEECFDTNDLTLKEFTNLFKKDNVSERITDVLVSLCL